MTWYKRGVQVCGVPGHLFEEELLRDKLIIHFLRPKNQGGEIQELRYPTKDSGVAILTFEDEEVAERILKTTHLLDVNGQSFVLEVMRLQFSMLVITSLDLSRFKNLNLLVDLLEKHRVTILGRRDETLNISAEFEDLRKFRSEIMAKALTCDTSPLGQRSRKQISVSGLESPVKDNLGVRPTSRQPSGNANNMEKPQSRRTPNMSSSHEKLPSRSSSHEKLPSRSNSHEKPPSRSNSHDKPPSRSNSHEKPPSRSNSHEKPPSRSNSYEILPSRSNSHEKPPSRSNSHEKPPSRSNSHEKPPSRSNSHEKPPSRSNSYEILPSRTMRREADMAPTFRNADTLRVRPMASTIDSVVQGSNTTSEGGMSFKATMNPRVRMNNDSVSQKLTDLNLVSSTIVRSRPSGEAIRTTRKPSAVTKDFPSEKALVKSFPVDKDVLHYIGVFKKQYIDEVLRRGFTDIEVAEGEDISYVTLKSQSPFLQVLFTDCCDKISELFSKGQNSLRTEDLDLTQVPPLARRDITKEIENLGRANSVAVVDYKDLLHLIGGSSHIHLLKERWKTISQSRPPYAGQEALSSGQISLPHPPDMGRSYAGANEKKTNHGDQDVAQAVRHKAGVTSSPQTVRTGNQSKGFVRHETVGVTSPKPNR
ncbi:uncharacterized protein XB22065629.S isoform X1 [Xenopus laevis]|uniref:Uncharacterized protein XB22065629.S isoform X1 n=1 Tax=Xenopus laevis TaxID=8355 RepID=A0A8J0VMF8_XENLA|nr:uncharacterized protein XB22065629.S isoform X1 [Xenopus laevis]